MATLLGLAFRLRDPELLKLGVGFGVISAAEVLLIEESWAARREVVRVDDFPAAYWKRGGGA